jgi:peptidoglycan/xylan/chitin deacetylase (PgdA/CDA1 family)
MYHRIAQPDFDPWGLCVSPQHFFEQLEVVRQFSSVRPLSDVLHLREQKRKPCSAVAVTFDDGYADNLLVAQPLLERFQVPATVFLTAGALGSPHEFWWDELSRILLQSDTLPSNLDLTIAGEVFRWTLRNSRSSGGVECRGPRSWKTTEPPSATRQALYQSVWRLLRRLSYSEQRRALDQLLHWACIEPVSRESHRILTISEAIALGSADLITIGAHTITHPELSAHPEVVQEKEIRESKHILQRVFDREITQFAYPYGAYSLETVRLVRDAGFSLACSTLQRTVPRDLNQYELPRYQVQNWSGEEFGRKLAAIFRHH